MPDRKNIIIIGAGISGISAAMKLAKQGYNISVYESNAYIGGRARSFSDNSSGDIIDNGQHLLSGAYTNFLEILRELNTDKYLSYDKSMLVHFADEHGWDILDATSLPGRAGMVCGLMRMKRLSFESKITMLKFFLKTAFGMTIPGTLSAKELLMKNSQTEEAIERFWEPLILATLNSSIIIAPASLLNTVIKKAFVVSKKTSRLLLPSAGLSELLKPFESWLASSGGSLHLKSGIKEIEIEKGKVVGVRTAAGIIKSDVVVAAVPPHSLAGILPDKFCCEKLYKLANSFQYSPIISIYLWFDRPFFNQKFAAMLGTESQWLFNRNAICKVLGSNQYFPGRYSITISGANHLIDKSPGEIVEIAIRDLNKIFPESKKAKLLHGKVIKEKRATVLIDYQIEKTRPGAATNIEGLYIAGDWINTSLPATLESAALSGVLAANEIMNCNNPHYSSLS